MLRWMAGHHSCVRLCGYLCHLSQTVCQSTHRQTHNIAHTETMGNCHNFTMTRYENHTHIQLCLMIHFLRQLSLSLFSTPTNAYILQPMEQFSNHWRPLLMKNYTHICKYVVYSWRAYNLGGAPFVDATQPRLFYCHRIIMFRCNMYIGVRCTMYSDNNISPQIWCYRHGCHLLIFCLSLLLARDRTNILNVQCSIPLAVESVPQPPTANCFLSVHFALFFGDSMHKQQHRKKMNVQKSAISLGKRHSQYDH